MKPCWSLTNVRCSNITINFPVFFSQLMFDTHTTLADSVRSACSVKSELCSASADLLHLLYPFLANRVEAGMYFPEIDNKMLGVQWLNEGCHFCSRQTSNTLPRLKAQPDKRIYCSRQHIPHYASVRGCNPSL